MECRCYHGGEGRTRLRQLHLGGMDFVLVAVCAAVFTLIGCSGMFWGLLGL